jgi:uncharacterized protein (TIGR03435 family)
VKRHLNPSFLRFSILPGGRLVVQGHPLSSIIHHAFGIPRGRVEGMPDWAQSERYDITAKPPEGSTGGSPQTMAMLQTLLKERFGLRAHTETRERPIYRLTLAREDRSLGPQLRPSDVDCTGFVPGRSEVPELNAGQNCVISGTLAGSSSVAIRMSGRSMAKLAADLEGFAGRPVRDATGLSGLFDVEVLFTPTNMVTILPGINEISILDAVQEQLGLRLQAAQGAVEVLVIDSLERPTPN